MLDTFIRTANEVVSWVSAHPLDVLAFAVGVGGLGGAVLYIAAPLWKCTKQTPSCPVSKNKSNPKATKHANP